MKLIVPTLNVQAMLAVEMQAPQGKLAVGEIVSIPYGVALQGLARGVISAIVNADHEHRVATEMLGIYGPDAWFQPQLQTIGKLSDIVNNPPPPEPNALRPRLLNGAS